VVSRGRARALGRALHQGVRAAADGADRRRDRRYRSAHVLSDLRAGREHALNPRELDSAPLILPEEIARARAAAQASGKRTVQILEEQCALPAEAFVAALGATLGYEIAAMGELDQLEPAFDLLPYTEGLARGCALMRSPDGELVMAFGDPFDAALRPWAEE